MWASGPLVVCGGFGLCMNFRCFGSFCPNVEVLFEDNISRKKIPTHHIAQDLSRIVVRSFDTFVGRVLWS